MKFPEASWTESDGIIVIRHVISDVESEVTRKFDPSHLLGIGRDVATAWVHRDPNHPLGQLNEVGSGSGRSRSAEGFVHTSGGGSVLQCHEGGSIHDLLKKRHWV